MAGEAPLVATVDDARPGDERVRLRPHGRLADLERLVDAMRADEPDDPLWNGVQDISTEGDALVITFHSGEDPNLLRTGAVDVACHLHDPRFRTS